MVTKDNLRSSENPAKQGWDSTESKKSLMERIRDLQHQEYSLQASITKTTGPNYRKLLEEKDREIEELMHYKEAYEALKSENEEKNSNTYARFPFNQSRKHRTKTMEKTVYQYQKISEADLTPSEVLLFFVACPLLVSLLILLPFVLFAYAYPRTK
ncbi:hypothetical protein GCK72_015462 [Caenorhabditis remanei]|uniref:Uncharacterized protein n=1 Tax=Caenorhabditis remanei TaxID=31234 RepID=A0A6A5GXA5_CAERE|nr:hypothetical protein GCK72_015462 [Caenorhabditis remanei]KAF1759002.1 hypothetical protein GCK72_015462 [Caenorhabditis remanei]